MIGRKQIERFNLAPATGRAVPVAKGQVFIVEQIADGQCLDLNLYNLHDYKEHFHSGRTRGLHGVNPTTGAHLWSAPPRERIMCTIVEDTVGTNDVNYSRCSAFLYEAHYGFDDAVAHSNCHDAFAEAIREWELTPDDVHDSFNGFMNTTILNGRLAIDRMVARRGDHLAFLAQMDLLAVPVCCGGDLGATNNYELKGLGITVAEANEADRAHLVDVRFTHQRTPEQYQNRTIKTDRALKRDPKYRAAFPWSDRVEPRHPIEISLEPDQRAILDRLQTLQRFHHMSHVELMRFVLFQWLERRHRKPIVAAIKERRTEQADRI